MKSDILRQANYRYSFDRDMYFNRAAKKAFSLEFVDGHPEEELVRHIQENKANDGWLFYSNSALPETVRRELESTLG
jgi:hypothetical protein